MTPVVHAERTAPSEVAGWRDAEGVVERVAHGSARVLAVVPGAAGSGKSMLLARIAGALRHRGIPVAEGLDAARDRESDERRPVILIDDAHEIAGDDVESLGRLLDGDGPHVVVAFRPTPRSPAWGCLEALARQHRTIVGLRPLTDAEVRARAADLLGDRYEHADRILELAHGNPRLCDALLAAVRDEGWDPTGEVPVPERVVDLVTAEVDAMDRDVREFLLALAVGYSHAGPALATAPRFALTDTRDLLAVARASGMARADGSVVPIVRSALLRIALPDELWDLRHELVEAMSDADAPMAEVAMELADQDFRDPRVAAALEAHGDHLLPTDPVGACRAFAAAVRAGSDQARVAARRAQAAWAAGDERAAERIVDRLLTRADAPDLARAVHVAAAVWARQGMLRRSADAYARLAETDRTAAPLAAICLAGIGDLERARATVADADDVPYPTSWHVASTGLAEGVLTAFRGDADRALSRLVHASSVMNESDELLPLAESPAVLAAQVALNAGELRIADDVLAAALDAAQGGPAFTGRLNLMRALVALRADRPAEARVHLDAADSGSAWGHRDSLLAHAVRVGLARHGGDVAALVRAWDGARRAIAAMQVDVYAIPALTELVVAAARLDELHLVEPHLTAAWGLFDGIGTESGWSVALHWAAAEAAMLRNDAGALQQHLAVLETATEHRVAASLAGAGRTWWAALGGDVRVDSVERAVRALVDAGYPWDAARLAGHAAGRAAEHRDSLHLLALARSLHPEDTGPAPRRGGSVEQGTDHAAAPSQLSAREIEVARLVLEGRTYAEIGRTIFISPRTAEHHIARIRRRLGASTRSELLARLRAELDGPEGR